MALHILTLVCPDRPGIVHSVSEGLLEVDANILENAQFGDEPTGTFCMRTRFETSIEDSADIVATLQPRATALGADLAVRREDRKCRTLVLVSKYDHCLVDLLYRLRTGELSIDIPVVVSNHPDLEETVVREGIPFEHVPVTPETRDDADTRLLDLVAKHEIDLVVLARYMQILSPGVCLEPGRAGHQHPSLVPARVQGG